MATQVTLNSGSVDSAGSLLLKTNGTTTAVTIDASQNVGVGVTPAVRLDVSGAASTNGDARFVAKVADTSAVAQGNGGGIMFRGVYTGTTLVDAAGIQAYKINATDNNYSYGLAFSTRADGGNLTTNMRLNESGNLGLGVTPSAWRNLFNVVQSGASSSFVGQTNSNTTYVSSNWYSTSGGTDTRIAAGYASQYYQDSGQHVWRTAATSTAGSAITFTQAMTLDASGNLGVGTSSPNGRLELSGTGPVILRLNDTATNYWQLESNSYLAFNRGGTERARIDSSGNWLVGTTVMPNSSTAGMAYNRGSTFLSLSCGATTTSVTQLYFTNGNGTVGSISTSGSLTSYNVSSDYRLKNTISPMTGALAKVSLLKPCTYKWNSDGSNGEGFIAHELAEVVPNAVTGAKDAVDKDGKPVYQGIDVSFLVATLTAAIQELKAEFDAYKASHP